MDFIHSDPFSLIKTHLLVYNAIDKTEIEVVNNNDANNNTPVMKFSLLYNRLFSVISRLLFYSYGS